MAGGEGEGELAARTPGNRGSAPWNPRVEGVGGRGWWGGGYNRQVALEGCAASEEIGVLLLLLLLLLLFLLLLPGVFVTSRINRSNLDVSD